MNLSLKRVTKYFVLTLVLVALVAGLGTTAYAASANASTQLQVVVGAAANISVVTASPTTLPLTGGTDFTGTYAGTTQIQFGLRTTSGGSATITVQGFAEFTPITGGNVGPSLDNADLSYTCTALDAAGSPALSPTGLTFCGGTTLTTKLLTPTNVLTGIGASKKTNNAQLTLTWTIPDNANWDADTYSGTVKFIVTAT
jgi:hypothetical protein